MPALEVFRDDRIALGYLYENWSGGAKWRIQTISSLLSRRDGPLALFLSRSFRLSLPRSRLSIGSSVFVRPPSQNSVPHVFSTQEFLTSSSYQVQKPVLPLSLLVVRDHAQIIDRVGERCLSTTSGLSSLSIFKHLFVHIFVTLSDKDNEDTSHFRMPSEVIIILFIFIFQLKHLKRCNSRFPF